MGNLKGYDLVTEVMHHRLPSLELAQAVRDNEEYLRDALKECLKIMSYYHVSDQGHLDSCENPGCCGHCLAVAQAVEALNR